MTDAAALDNYYEIFDIARDADPTIIQTSLRAARKRWRQLTGSPDRERAQLAERRMAQLEVAEKTLLDGPARQQYDAAIAAQEAQAPAANALPVGGTDWAERAKQYFESGDIRNAFNAAKKGTDVDAANNLTWYYYVQSAVELKRIEDADFASAELVQRIPAVDVSHDLRGGVLESMGRFAEAETSFRTAARISPDNSYYHGRAAWAVLDQGDVDRAVEEAWGLVQRFDGDAYPLKILRAACEKLREQKQPQRALPVAQRLIGHSASDENILEAVVSIQEIEEKVDVDIALAEARRLFDAFPHSAAAQRLVRYMIGALRTRGRQAEALAEARMLIARCPNDQEAKHTLGWSIVGDAESQMAATGPGSHIILNRAQAAYYGNAVAELWSLEIADQRLRAAVQHMREYHAKQTRMRVNLSFGRIVLAIIAVVLLIIGLSTLPSGLAWIVVAALVGWAFYALTFTRQYRMNYRDATPNVRGRGLQK